MEKNKRTYPSQVNTKTISARIPTEDYVMLLQESLNKGITLSDYILLKIYGKQEKVNGTNDDHDNQDENDKDMQQSLHESLTWDNVFPINIATPYGTNYEFEDETDIFNTIRYLEDKAKHFEQKLNDSLLNDIRNKTSIDLDDVNVRNTVFIAIVKKIKSIEWDTKNDRILCLKDFKQVWDDMFN